MLYNILAIGDVGSTLLTWAAAASAASSAICAP